VILLRQTQKARCAYFARDEKDIWLFDALIHEPTQQIDHGIGLGCAPLARPGTGHVQPTRRPEDLKDLGCFGLLRLHHLAGVGDLVGDCEHRLRASAVNEQRQSNPD